MTVRMKKFLWIGMGGVVALLGGVYLATENEYAACCGFSCARPSARDSSTETWRVKGYVRMFKETKSFQDMERKFSNSREVGCAQIHRIFQTCEFKVVNGTIPEISIQVRSSDEILARRVVEFLAKEFSNMLENRNRQVFEKQTARANMEIKKAKRKGDPVPEGAIREIETARSLLEKEDFRVYGIRETEVRFWGRRWRWCEG